MKPPRKLSDGILPCGRCGVEPAVFRRGHKNIQYFSYECPACELHTEWKDTVADTIVAWNNLAARTHPEPEDYLELLEECLWQLKDDDTLPHEMVCLLCDLRDEFGDDYD